MSGIVGVFATTAAGPVDQLGPRLLGALRQRGADRRASWSHTHALLAVTRNEWEMSPSFAGEALVLWDGECAVVADATLYYTDDLRRSLRAHGVEPNGSTPSHFILAAYRAWQDDCIRHLEGDFAFLLWDARRARALAARDFSGKRPLFVAECGDSVVVASSIAAALAHPHCPRELDLAAIAETAAGLFADPRATCYRAITTLPAGWSFSWEPGTTRRLRQEWELPVPSPSRLPFEDAAAELRRLLVSSVGERLDSEGNTSMWLSGGWDSTAVFAAGFESPATSTAPRRLRPVSISYPPGDPGREDELVEAVAQHCGADVHWLQIDAIPMFRDAVAAAAQRDEPFAHAFEMWNRALARGSRAVGARVALEGVGGDQLFQVSDVYLADLLRSGRWLALAREWRRGPARAGGARGFFQWAILPSLPRTLRTAARVLTGGRPLMGHLERALPAWIDPDFARRHELIERQRRESPARRARSLADHEMVWYLTHAYFPKVFACVSGLALDEGVEIRSPLYDQRVIALATSRPRWERSSRGETKRLLREAVRGLVPDVVLAPRSVRTGVTGAYFDRSMRAAFPTLAGVAFREPLLAELGIVDPVMLRRASEAYLRDGWGGAQTGVCLFFTLQTELWLRGHLGDERVSRVAAFGASASRAAAEPDSAERRHAAAPRKISAGTAQ